VSNFSSKKHISFEKPEYNGAKIRTNKDNDTLAKEKE
jgi:hypothetical protein